MKAVELEKVSLVICKIIGLFVNTLTADDKYSLFNRGNLTQPIQMQLCQKQKSFFQSFSAVLKSKLSFEYFHKRNDPHG